MSIQYKTVTPEEVAKSLGASPWWVREQVRRGRVPHLRFGRGRIRFLPEHVDALVRLVTVQGRKPADDAPATSMVGLRALGATARSIGAHERRPHVEGDSLGQ
ncbi:helix-turn-helix domain-containing protein [Cellulomonas sp. URHE0023]|uniref:helix-turn-helix domain-containing protein n=1 Tax=Cellulomonas sp. URHE0023 TaxID=1380354 RepID=UPI0012DCEDAE